MGFLQRFSRVVAVSSVVGGVVGGVIAASPGQAETVLQETGTIAPAEATYTFTGEAGQTVTITLDSTEFDPVLSLLDSSGQEIATNDDFGGTLNSTIIFELPTADTYTVLARSFSGQGGAYNLVVRDASEFEITYAAAEALVLDENYAEAIVGYTEAIDLDPEQASAYLGRAQATLGQVYAEGGAAIEGPEDIPAEARASVIADFEQAATLIEASGSADWAASLREQAELLRGADSPPK
ncbi:MAG: pre-peptidase C-terminal domain-containing protein [Nodosilinea sp.]